MESDATSVQNKNKKLEYIIDYCRVCMCRRDKEDMISIFDSQVDNILSRIQFCTGVEFKKEDGLPTHICNNCTQNLTVAHKFKTSCLESDNLFRKIFQEGLKDEPEDFNNFINNYDDGDTLHNVSTENVRKSIDNEVLSQEKAFNENTRKKQKISYENLRKYFKFDFEDEAIEKVSNENVRKSMDSEDESLENVSNENVRKSMDSEDESLEKVSNENVRKSIDYEDEALQKVSNENVIKSMYFDDDVLEKVSNENRRKKMKISYENLRKYFRFDFEDGVLDEISNNNLRKSTDCEDEVLEKVSNENVRKSMDFEDEVMEKVPNENIRQSMDSEDESLEKVLNENVRKSMDFKDDAVENISNENVRITRARVKKKDSNQKTYFEIKTGNEIEKETPKIIREPNKKSTVEKRTDKKTRSKIKEEKNGPKTIREPHNKSTEEKEKENERPKIIRVSQKKSKQTNITPLEVARLQCEPCNLKFKSKAESIKHVKMVHKYKRKNIRRVCEICGKITSRADHMLSHQPPKYECAHCDYKTSKKPLLAPHVLRHGEKRFQCDLCSIPYHTKRQLKEHILFYHEGVKKFQCDICDKRFSRKYDLNMHYTSHSEKPFECEVCHQRIASRKSLRDHLRKYHGVELPYERCGPKMDALNDETGVITKSTEGDKLYKCKLCPRSYHTFTHLNSHVLICHEAGKQPQCDICNKQFADRGRLKIHMSIHDPNKRIECELCHNTFSRRAFWRLHLQRQHGIKASAPRCGLKISPREEMALLLSNNTGAIAKSHAKQTLATDN